jgi:hypothetical protein
VDVSQTFFDQYLDTVPGYSTIQMLEFVTDLVLSSPIVGEALFVTAIAALSVAKAARKKKDLANESKTYYGSCHCGAVSFEAVAPRHLVAWDCNCSICHMKKNWHFVVPIANFTVTSGSDVVTEYQFNTKVAKHVFCSKCGVQAYYRPRSNPDGVAVTLACIPTKDIESSEIKKFDGSNWEQFYANSGISEYSKAKN